MNFNQIAFETSFGRPDQLTVSDMPEIAFAGRSNVGKSSMINRVFSRKNLARVSSSPGKTATINFFKLPPLRFVDLPGYGFARVSKEEQKRWGDLMESYFQSGRNIRLVLLLLDFRHLPSQDDHFMLSFLKESGFPFAVVLTKTDKLKSTERARLREQFDNYLVDFAPQQIVEFSSETGEGTEELRDIFQKIANEVL